MVRKTAFSKHTKIICILSAVFLIAGCAPAGQITLSASSVSSVPLETVSLNTSPSTEELPLENLTSRFGEIQNFKDIGAQFLCDHPESYTITAAIYAYRDYNNSIIFDQPFEDIQQADPSLLVEIAASQAPHVDLYNADFYTAPSSDPVKSFYQEQLKQGHRISLISYGDDVRKTAKALFGEDYQLPAANGLTMLYHPELDIYYLDHYALSLSTDYPVLVSVTEVPNGYQADVVIMAYWDCYDSWGTLDGSWNSEDGAPIYQVRDYVNAHLTELPQYSFTLQKTPDRLNGLSVTGVSLAA